MGNNLDSSAQIFSGPLLFDDRLVDLPRGDGVGPAQFCGGESAIVAEVEIGFCTVVGDIDLAVLIGTHRAGIDIEVGIDLYHLHGKATRFHESADRGRCDPLPKRRAHPSGYKY